MIKLNPYYITGFADAEGCFHLNLDKNSYPRFCFLIGLNSKDKDLIDLINHHFNNKGRISYYQKNDEVRLTFENLESINNYIIPHFDQSPLFGLKSLDYQSFKKGMEMINNGEYKSFEGLKKDSEYAISMNEGIKKNIIRLYPDLKETTKNYSLYDKSALSLLKKNPWWMTGFIDGEGSFSLTVKDKGEEKKSFQPSLSVSQHVKNTQLFEQFKEFFNCGNLYAKKASNGEYKEIQYQISSNKQIKENVLPHFEKYPLISFKKKVYEVWSESIKLLSNEPSNERNEKLIKLRKRIKELNK